ncbi:MAG TPA: hypothetical protein VGP17_02675 [Solirubrobacteraceae bacterium]|nr:hypothetical protein [Solirubrobacteraceae bacterium]
MAPHHTTAGEPVVVFGRLRCPGGGESAQTVQLFHHLTGQPGSSYVQSVTTNTEGYYEINPADGVVETSRSFFVVSGRARSRTQQVRVSAQVTLSGPAEGSQLLTGKPNQVTFTGTVAPTDVGAEVVLQRQDAENGQTWHHIGDTTVAADGTFTLPHTFIVPGDASIRALVRSQGRNVPSSSNVIAYEISQAQNSALTIEASADPIVVGGSVTLGGKLAGVSTATPVQLFAHTRYGHFTAVAEISTNASGEYSFAPQSPLHSTFYKVKAGGQTSAVLFEGVHDLLSVEPPATSVQQGQPLQVSGSVSPQHGGHVIYLEAQDAFGGGFHVIQIGFLGAGSTYDLQHRFYELGNRVLRVFIPGGPENEGAASPTFTVDVTPAPLPALMPEPEGNTSEAPEGQS